MCPSGVVYHDHYNVTIGLSRILQQLNVMVLSSVDVIWLDHRYAAHYIGKGRFPIGQKSAIWSFPHLWLGEMEISANSANGAT